MKKFVIGCDEAALELKNTLRDFLIDKGYDVIDKGVYDAQPVLYPSVAYEVSKTVADEQADRGILCCGTGIGMAITANKVPGIRAAVCHDILSTRRSVLSNNCQIICFGSRVVAKELAVQLLDEWIDLEFDNPNSQIKIDRITEIEGDNYNAKDNK